MFMINISIEVNSVSPDQTAPTGAVWPQEQSDLDHLCRRGFKNSFNRWQKQMIFEIVVVFSLRFS